MKRRKARRRRVKVKAWALVNQDGELITDDKGRIHASTNFAKMWAFHGTSFLHECEITYMVAVGRKSAGGRKKAGGRRG